MINFASVYTNFDDYYSYRCLKIFDRMFNWRDGKWTNKMNDKQGSAYFQYTIQIYSENSKIVIC